MEYVSDLVTVDIIEALQPGNNYLISSEMNSGKNYWARNVLLPFADKSDKRTLLLSHRINTLQQQSHYLEDYRLEKMKQFRGGMFEMLTYQRFQNMIRRGDPMIDTFDYIVCDEAHYFISDSSFNPATELAFNFLNDNEEAVKIFMTGTPDGLYYLPWAQGLKILKEADYYNNNVKDLYRYENDETVSSAIKSEVEDGKKVMVFHQSKDTLDNFKIGNYRSLYAGNQEQSLEFKEIVEQQKFSCDVLNTTKLLSEATEIKDDDVETVVINGISNIDTFIQSSARVRNKKVKVLYKRISQRSTAAKLNYLGKQLFYYEEFISLGEVGFIEEYGLDIINKQMKAFYLDKVIDPKSYQEYTRLKIHQTGLAYLKYQYQMYEYIYENGFEAFFETYFPNIQYYDLEQLKRENYIQIDIINNYIGKKLFKEEQEELKKMICNKYGLRGKNNSMRIGMKTINSFFEDNNISYNIQSKKETSRSSEKYGNRYWLIKES